MMIRMNISGFLKVPIVLLLVVFIYVPATFAEPYELDPAHTSIIFRVKHLGLAYVFGRFNGATGTFSYDETAPTKTTVDIRVEAKNIDTNDQKRDNHLRSPDFFNEAKFPVIKFKSTSVKKADDDLLLISGNLTILGKTQPITIKVRHTGAGKDPWGNYRRGFESSFTIKRTDFGMNFMLGGVSDKVDLIVSVQGIRQ